jgi:hypothetical protein
VSVPACVLTNCVCVYLCVCACADNFVAETSREKDDVEQSKIEDDRQISNITHVLDPVLKVVATEYVDEVFICV